ncbi:MAG: twin-arginine translocation signal domain-containing protein, partial [Pseudomonadota bacterium]
MDRRTFLKSSGVAAATATSTITAQQALAAPANVKQRIEITAALAPQFQRGYLRDRADQLALSMRSVSDGRIDVQFVDTTGSGAELARTGEVQAYFGTEADHLSLEPGLGFFAGLPGDLGLKPDDYKSWLTAGGGQMHWDSIAAELGLKSFAAGHSGPAPGLWATTDLVLLEHVQGKRLLATGLAARVGERLGFAMAADIDAADAVEVPVGRTAAIADGLIGTSQFWLAGGITNGGHVLSFGLSRDVWERLDDADKALI